MDYLLDLGEKVRDLWYTICMNTQENSLGSMQVFFEWTVPSRVQHQRSVVWYGVATAIVIGLLLFSISTTNFLFGVMIVLVIFIVVIHESKPIRDVAIALTNKGLIIDRHLYQYKDFASFYIIYEPPYVQKLIFERNVLNGPIVFDIATQEPHEIRNFLLTVVPENTEKEDEPTSEWLSDVFKL